MDTRALARLIAGGFGTGGAPLAPGTAASLAALAVAAALLQWSPWAVVAACLAATLGGWIAIRRCEVAGDPGWVVIDEFAGQFAAAAALPRPTWLGLGLGLAFALFRALDIAKPGPVGWADRQPGATGIMADDLVAGLIAAALIGAIRWGFPGALG